MTIDDLKRKIVLAAKISRHQPTVDVDTRARAFIASLSGLLELGDEELAAAVWAVLQPLPSGPSE